MKQFAELVPIVLFFLSYQVDGQTIDLAGFEYTFDGIYSATAILIAATAIQLILTRLLTGHIEKRLWILFAAVAVFGSATLFFRSEAFIQWKPTVFNWVLAALFIGAPLLGKKTLLERGLGDQIALPAQVWSRLNMLWTANFIFVGALNIFVAYRFSEATWVSYKLYSAIGFTLVLTIITAVLIAPHISESDDNDAGEQSS